MTDYFVGPGGNDANSGVDWTNRKLTVSGAHALSLVGGDDVLIGPGYYPELLTLAKGGGSLYTTGTVSVTRGSAVVTGSGTTFTGNVFVNGVFQIRVLASGTDGVTTGTDATFTSAAGNFQQGHVGYVLSIATKAPYRIATVVSATSITLENADGTAAAPTAGTGLTYTIGPESPHDIAVVTDNTHITLTKPWHGPTLTGVAYRCYRPIRFIGDVKGHRTDGVGGPVVMSASNDYATQTRTSIVGLNTRQYVTFRGISYYLGDSTFTGTTASDIIVEDFLMQGPGVNVGGLMFLTGAAIGIVLRRGIIVGGRAAMILLSNATAVDNSYSIFENIDIQGGSGGIGISLTRYGNCLARNNTIRGCGGIQATSSSPTAGQAFVVTNNILHAGTTGVAGVAATPEWLFEDYNAVFANNTNHSNARVGAHTLTTSSPLVDPPLLTCSGGYREEWYPWDLMDDQASHVSPLRNKVSAPYPGEDLYGMPRPQGTAPNWGAFEPGPKAVRETTVIRNGTSALKLPGRSRQFMRVPVTFGQAFTLTAYFRWDTDASIGLKPQMVLLADYGVAEQTAVATGNGTSFTNGVVTIGPITPTAPAVGNTAGGEMIVAFDNRNTDAANIAVYLDDFSVT